MKKNTKYTLLALAAFCLLLIAGQIEFDALQVNQVGDMEWD